MKPSVNKLLSNHCQIINQITLQSSTIIRFNAINHCQLTWTNHPTTKNLKMNKTSQNFVHSTCFTILITNHNSSLSQNARSCFTWLCQAVTFCPSTVTQSTTVDAGCSHHSSSCRRGYNLIIEIEIL